MHLTLDALSQLGGFSGELVEREITWTQDGLEQTFTLYVRPLSYQNYVQELDNISKGRISSAERIAACICDPQGKPIMTPEDITGEGRARGAMNAALVTALDNLVFEVSGLGKILISPTKMNSGTSSSSMESEAAPSPKLNGISATQNSSSGRSIEPSVVR